MNPQSVPLQPALCFETESPREAASEVTLRLQHVWVFKPEKQLRKHFVFETVVFQSYTVSFVPVT